MADPPFVAEYARSNRSSCRRCRQKIEKGTLRVARMVQSPHFDGMQPMWYHMHCAKKIKQKPSSIDQVGGYIDVRPEDQAKLRDYAGGGGGKAGGAAAGPGDGFAEGDMRVEYAKSNRSTCQHCETGIPKDSVRICRVEIDPMATMTFPVPRWHHAQCFFSKFPEVTLPALAGVDGLSEEDRGVLEKFCGGGDEAAAKPPEESPASAAAAKGPSTPSKKRARGGRKGKAATAAPASPKSKTELLEAQNREYWAMRDLLSDKVSRDWIVEVLTENGYLTSGGRDRLVQRCADGLLFGALKPCPLCKSPLELGPRDYRCSGHVTAWAKCTYHTRDPARRAFKIPSHMKEDVEHVPKLAKYKYRRRTRIFPEESGPPSTPAAAAAPLSKFVGAETDEPLAGFVLAFAGRLSKSQAKLRGAVAVAGGETAVKPGPEVTCLVTTQSEVDKESARVTEARESTLPIVSEALIHEAIEARRKPRVASFMLQIGGHATPAASAPPPASTPSAGAGVGRRVVKMLKRGRAVVDAESGLQDQNHVVLDVKGKLYSETMTRADAGSGVNSFYILQVISNDRGSRFYLFRRWGRVGSDTIGGSKLEGPFHSRRAATDAFEAQFYEKTGIPYSVPAEERVKTPGAFFPIEVRFGETEEGEGEGAEAEAEKKPSTLSKPVQELMRLIFDQQMLQRTMNELEIDLNQLPLGKLSQRTVGLAYQALKELEDVAVDDSDAAGRRLLAQLQSGDVDALPKRMRKRYTALLDASNRFYSLVPHVTYGAPLPLLASKRAVADKTKLLDSLAEIEIASSLLRAVRGSKASSEHPLDAQYRALRADIRPVLEASEEMEMIRRYVTNTHAATHRQYGLEVLHAYTVDRNGEAERFAPWANLHNQRLLWHGSRVSNVVGILSQGLRIAPPEAPVTGYMFGKGVYLADSVSKSANYCRATPDNNVGILFLCRAALGDMYKIGQAQYMEAPPPGYHSTFGMGRTGPVADGDPWYTADGVEVPLQPLGKTPVKQTSLLYNEFIVYDTSQLLISHVAMVRFDFRHR